MGFAMPDENTNDSAILLERAAEIVAAYVSNNSLQVSELASLIQAVHVTLAGLESDGATTISRPTREPAVPIKKSVTDEFIICLEDGKKFQSLKRHLRTTYSMTPEEYRAKWRLPFDYPMVASNYASRRSQIAKDMGLGMIGPSKRKSSSAKSKPTPS
jgi:predicted transcriptional regulator